MMQMRNFAHGNVGIGTATPGAKLDVAGVVRYGSASSNGQLSYGASGLVTLEGVSANTSIALLPTGTGNVGIGTTSPSAKLEVAGTEGADGIKFLDGFTQVHAARGSHFCGTTSSTYDGLGVGGWTGAAAKCRATSGCSAGRAVMCTSAAIVMHLQDGAMPMVPTTGKYWVADTYYSGWSGGALVNACLGRTTNSSNTTASNGAVYTAANKAADNFYPCNQTFKLMCCD